MKSNNTIHSDFKANSGFFDDIIYNFDSKGENFGDQDRNSLKLFQLGDKTINVKSFRIPHLINQIVYRFFRKSKAQRSYEYANKLIEMNVGTPKPIGYYEFKTLFLFNKSYYISEQLDCDLIYRDLVDNLNYPNHDAILRAFTRFTYQLHEKGILFLDHSVGNTLIKLNNGDYQFFLVDLNRMEFRTLDFETRVKNFSRLTIQESIVEVMSDEYAKCSGEDYNEIFNLMWSETLSFQEDFYRRRRLKKRYKFWK